MSGSHNPLIIGHDRGLNFHSVFCNLIWMSISNNEHFLVLLSTPFHVSSSEVWYIVNDTRQGFRLLFSKLPVVSFMNVLKRTDLI